MVAMWASDVLMLNLMPEDMATLDLFRNVVQVKAAKLGMVQL